MEAREWRQGNGLCHLTLRRNPMCLPDIFRLCALRVSAVSMPGSEITSFRTANASDSREFHSLANIPLPTFPCQHSLANPSLKFCSFVVR